MNELVEKAVPIVEIILGGKKRSLVCSMWVLWKFQKETNRNPFELKVSELSPEDMLLILTFAIQQEEPEVTMEQVAKMFSTVHFPELAQLFNKLFNIAKPTIDKDSESDSGEAPADAKKK